MIEGLGLARTRLALSTAQDTRDLGKRLCLWLWIGELLAPSLDCGKKCLLLLGAPSEVDWHGKEGKPRLNVHLEIAWWDAKATLNPDCIPAIPCVSQDNMK